MSLIDIQSFVPTRHKRPGLGSFESRSAALTVEVSNAGIGVGTCMTEWGAHPAMADSSGTAIVLAYIKTPCGQMSPSAGPIFKWRPENGSLVHRIRQELSRSSKWMTAWCVYWAPSGNRLAEKRVNESATSSWMIASTAVSLRRRTDKASNISKLVSANNTSTRSVCS